MLFRSLKRVIEQKKLGGDGMRVQTDIVCKHFLDAIESKKYGWFWECPNGGDKCQYRHALPAGYVLKSEVKDTEDNTEQLEDRIERERRALTTRTLASSSTRSARASRQSSREPTSTSPPPARRRDHFSATSSRPSSPRSTRGAAVAAG